MTQDEYHDEIEGVRHQAVEHWKVEKLIVFSLPPNQGANP